MNTIIASCPLPLEPGTVITDVALEGLIGTEADAVVFGQRIGRARVIDAYRVDGVPWIRVKLEGDK